MIMFPLSFYRWPSHKILLLGGCFLVLIGSIILHNTGIFPLDVGTFIFFSLVMLLFALYRPSWAFLLFIGVLPLEAISIAPLLFGGVMLRPYQWLTMILLVAVSIRFFSGRLPFRLFRWQWFDMFPGLIVLGSFIALVNAPVLSVAVKQTLVVASFVAVYFLGRIFFRTTHDARQALPFFLASSFTVFGYALWQSVRDLLGQKSFQVMAGRPNATFVEADWLGMFVLVALAVSLTLLFHTFMIFLEDTTKKRVWIRRGLVLFFLTSAFTVLILTVARSAWLGALGVVGVFSLGVLFRDYKDKIRGWKRSISFGACVGGSFLAALGIIAVFHLSPFQLFNRIQSTGGQELITVSCLSGFDQALPKRVHTVAELPAICTHIRLEDVEREKQAGYIVYEVYRDDPNVSIRKQVYMKAGSILAEHPVLGIGWGGVQFLLGPDERGAGLNASNVFLEVWLGSGALGLAAFVIFLGAIAWASFRWYCEADYGGEQVFALFLFSTLFGMMVFDLFNSGILLGFFFIFLSLGTLALESKGVFVRVSE